MKKISLFFTIVIAVAQCLHASTIDTLETKLETSSGKERVDIYLELSAKYAQLKDSTHAFQYADLVLEAPSKQVSPQMKAQAYYTYGSLYCTLKEYVKAVDYYQKALTETDEVSTMNSKINYELGICCFEMNDLKHAKEYLEESFKISQEIGLPELSSLALKARGSVEEVSGNYAQSINLFLHALEIAEQYSYLSLISSITDKLGALYLYLGNYSSSIHYYLRSLSVKEELGSTPEVSVVLRKLGNVYKASGELKKALIYFQRSLALEEALGSKQGEIKALKGIAHIEVLLNELNKALKHYQQEQEIEQTLGDQKALAVTINNIGSILSKQGHYDNALEKHLTAFEISQKIDDPHLEIQCLSNIGLVYLLQNNYSSAEQYLTQALEISAQMNDKAPLLNIYKELSQVYEKSGDKEKAYNFLLKYTSLRDSIISKESAERFLELQAKYESQNKEKEITLLRKEQEIREIEVQKHKMLRNVVIIVTILIIIIALIILNRYKYKTQANEELNTLNQKLDELAKTDPLTNLSNRRNIIQKIEYQQIVFERYGRAFTILLADIDDFKAINDTYGHDAGDHILISLSTLISENIRKQDFVGRWGGTN